MAAIPLGSRGMMRGGAVACFPLCKTARRFCRSLSARSEVASESQRLTKKIRSDCRVSESDATNACDLPRAV